MQHAKDLKLFGMFLKTHGIDGHLVIKLFFDPEDEPQKGEPVFIEIDGIPVPFFIDEFRFISDDSAIVHFDEINSPEEASAFINCRAFTGSHREYGGQETQDIDYTTLTGFSVVDDKLGNVGILREIVEYSENILMLIDFKDKEILVPFHDDIVKNIDPGSQVINISAPEGIFDINN